MREIKKDIGSNRDRERKREKDIKKPRYRQRRLFYPYQSVKLNKDVGVPHLPSKDRFHWTRYPDKDH